MKIQVTQKDIALAQKRLNLPKYNCAMHCPIALAVKRKTHQLVMVGTRYIFVMPRNRPYRAYEHHGETKRFIRRFDSGKPVKPFTFTVNTCKR